MRQEDMPKANATCVICGKKYFKCEKCIRLHAQGTQPWKMYCDKDRCYVLYCLLEWYANKTYTKEEALRELTELGYIDGNLLCEDSKYKKIYDEIVQEPVKQDAKAAMKKVVEEKVEE